MKKILSVLLASALIFVLAGCGDEDKKPNSTADSKKVEKTEKTEKSIKKFVPAEEEKFRESIIEGWYTCSAKEFMKKTNGNIGKSCKKITSNNGEKIDILGIQVTPPSKEGNMYIFLADTSNNEAMILFDEDIEDFGFSESGLMRASNKRTGGLFYWSTINEENKEFPLSIAILNEKNIGILGRYGTIGEKEVIANDENSLVFTKMNEEDLKKFSEK